MAAWMMAVCVHVALHVLVISCQHSVHMDRQPLDGRLFRDALHLQSRSSLDCARTCAANDDCVTFTFVPESKTCRGYFQRKTLADSSDPVAGARTYNLRMPYWLNKPCADTASCVAVIPPALQKGLWDKLPVCFKGRCLCQVPTFYSVSQRLCKLGCPVSDLQTTYSQYPQSLVNLPGSAMTCVDLATCTLHCSSSTQCHFFAGSASTSTFYRGVYPAGITDASTQDRADWNMYHKHCA
ncbi:uncharacterized protein LOC143277154 [Babylonia areolata]|uniref:uncharacterized protein LOC143277154 n=1 Tax=Babylonia areolata TaxID=304850 RepID=UPI003FD496D7